MQIFQLFPSSFLPIIAIYRRNHFLSPSSPKFFADQEAQQVDGDTWHDLALVNQWSFFLNKDGLFFKRFASSWIFYFIFSCCIRIVDFQISSIHVVDVKIWCRKFFFVGNYAHVGGSWLSTLDGFAALSCDCCVETHWNVVKSVPKTWCLLLWDLSPILIKKEGGASTQITKV